MRTERIFEEVGRLYLQNIELQQVITAQAQQIADLTPPQEEPQPEDEPAEE